MGSRIYGPLNGARAVARRHHVQGRCLVLGGVEGIGLLRIIERQLTDFVVVSLNLMHQKSATGEKEEKTNEDINAAGYSVGFSGGVVAAGNAEAGLLLTPHKRLAKRSIDLGSSLKQAVRTRD